MKSNTASKPIILVGGGTGGHIMPLVAIGEELERQARPFIFVGSRGGREAEIVGKLGWSFVAIEAGKWRRYWSLTSIFRNLVDGVRVVVGFFQSVSLLQRTGARTVVSKGGFVALPMVYAARLLRRRLIIHESDALMGATNRLSAGFADVVLTAFAPEVYPSRSQRFVQVGIPIRRSLRQAAKLKSPTKTRPLILVIGGIQGASAINKLLAPVVGELATVCDVVHSTGEADIATFTALRDELGANEQSHYKPFAFIDRELSYYYQLADVVIARASATTLAEAATFKKASYLIPLPNAAGNHQVINAERLAQAQAVMVGDQNKLTPDALAAAIKKLLNDPAQIEQLGANLHRYFNADRSLDQVMEVINHDQ